MNLSFDHLQALMKIVAGATKGDWVSAVGILSGRAGTEIQARQNGLVSKVVCANLDPNDAAYVASFRPEITSLLISQLYDCMQMLEAIRLNSLRQLDASQEIMQSGKLGEVGEAYYSLTSSAIEMANSVLGPPVSPIQK